MTKRRQMIRGHTIAPKPAAPAIRQDGPLSDVLQSNAWRGLAGAYNFVQPDRIKRRIMALTIDAATSGDWYLEGEKACVVDDATFSSPAHAALDDMNFPRVLHKALMIASESYGGESFILACGDGSVDGFRALRIGECSPHTVIDDVMSANNGKATSYLVGNVVVPADRIISVQTNQTTRDIHCAVEYYRDCLGAIQEGVRRSQQAVYKSTGLANTLRASGGVDAVKARLEAMDKFRGMTNTVAIDGEEDFSITQAGIGPIVSSYFEVACKHLCMVSGVPEDILFGRNQTGLNGGNAANNRWIGVVSRYQRDVLAPVLENALKLIGHNGRVVFESLDQETDKDRSDRLGVTAAALEKMVSLGIMDTEDARRHLIREGLVDVIDMPTDDNPQGGRSA